MDLTRTLVYGGILVLGAALYWWTGQEPAAVPARKAKPKPSISVTISSDYTDADFDARFAKPKVKLRNLFLPLVLSPREQTDASKAKKEDIVKIPANFAEGDPNWAYTGYCVVNGERMALLENSAKHEAGYVKEGETWKKSTIRRITSASIVIANADGEEEIVLRYSAFTKPKAEQPIQPVSPTPPPGLRGPIGPIGPNNVRVVPSPGGSITVLPGVLP